MGVCVVSYSTGKETNKDKRPTAEKDNRRVAMEEK
jgi:hypothetical protein